MIVCTHGLINGGLAGLFWSYIWTFVGFTFVEMSSAEMASIYVSIVQKICETRTDTHSGLQHLAANITGCLSLRHHSISNFCSTS